MKKSKEKQRKTKKRKAKQRAKNGENKNLFQPFPHISLSDLSWFQRENP
jgi:hypothetical protein